MNIIRRLSDGLVQYAIDGEVWLTENALVTPKFKASDISSNTHEIVSGIALPPYFTGGSHFYNDGWSTANQGLVDAMKAKESEVLLHKTDAQMARVIEDIYSVLTAEQKSALPQAAKDKIAERQALRAKL